MMWGKMIRGGILLAVAVVWLGPPRASASAGASSEVPVVAIDPGHGGTNVGARAPGGIAYEKDVTLSLSRHLAEALKARGIRVVSTRDGDTYVSLRRRMAIAERAGADAFLSVHANATASGNERGYETFILSPRAVDTDAPAIRPPGAAARAHRADSELAPLLADLERGAAIPRAAELASAVQTELRAVRGEEGDRGVRQAPFDVLFGASMPAVLVEVGFLDHPFEGLELLYPAVQKRIAEALADAVAEEVGAGAAAPRGIAEAGDSS